MNMNPYDKVCADLKAQLTARNNEQRRVSDELAWYSGFDRAATELRLQEAESKQHQLQRFATDLAQKIRDSSIEIGKLSEGIGSVFNPRNWFDQSQASLRRQRSQQIRTRDQHQRRQHSLTDETNAVAEIIKKTKEALSRYHLFDHLGAQEEFVRLKNDIELLAQRLSAATRRQQEVDRTISPALQNHDEIEGRLRAVAADLEVAEEFDQEITSAANSYERAMAHKSCQERFGEGSPRRVIAQKRRLASQLEADLKKAQERLRTAVADATRTIDSVVIDGNNMCYESGDFIGLAALESIVHKLATSYSVVVIFDTSILRLTGRSEASIKSGLGGNIKVHVVRESRAADETILALASQDQYSYVISNDRFGDYSEMPAVRDGRVFRHEIVGGLVSVPKLQLKANFYNGQRGKEPAL